MDGREWLAVQFENHRPHLRSVAYRMLGSLAEADDAIQETWLRVSRADAEAVRNLGGWLTTITARVCLNMLRRRRSRGETPIDVRLPDPIVTSEGHMQPEDEAVLSDSVGIALLVVLDTLAPAERLAFVLHDLFQLPFNEIATMIERTPEAARQLASRARRTVKGADLPSPDVDRGRQRRVVDAFFNAARRGDFAALLELLDEGVVLRADYGGLRGVDVVRGREKVAEQSLQGGRLAAEVHPALVNGSVGAVTTVGGRPFAIMGFVVANDRIVAIDAFADRERVTRLAAGVVDAS